MNIEEARLCALAQHNAVTEDEFSPGWISYRIGGKWFMLIQLDAPEPRVAVKLPPERGAELRERHPLAIRPAYHMNKTHWSDLYLNEIGTQQAQALIGESFALVAHSLSKKAQTELGL